MFEHINEKHRPTQVNDDPFCWVCGVELDKHWYPNPDIEKLKDLHLEVEEIAKQAWEGN